MLAYLDKLCLALEEKYMPDQEMEEHSVFGALRPFTAVQGGDVANMFLVHDPMYLEYADRYQANLAVGVVLRQILQCSWRCHIFAGILSRLDDVLVTQFGASDSVQAPQGGPSIAMTANADDVAARASGKRMLEFMECKDPAVMRRLHLSRGHTAIKTPLAEALFTLIHYVGWSKLTRPQIAATVRIMQKDGLITIVSIADSEGFVFKAADPVKCLLMVKRKSYLRSSRRRRTGQKPPHWSSGL